MKTKIYSALYFFVLSFLLVFSSCDKYLDVQSEDQFLDEQAYESRINTMNVLNGIYINMASASLYGENLSMTYLDILAQNYNTSSRTTHRYISLSDYLYNDARPQSYATNVWNQGYSVILNINLFIENVSRRDDVLSDVEKSILLGEAYGLRAYMAFDLFRLFAPAMNQNSTTPIIPYPQGINTDLSQLLSPDDFLDSVQNDIARSMLMLAEDPVLTEGVVEESTLGTGFQMRNKRFNYFAAKGLLARVALYRGNETDAYTLAQEIVEEASAFFPWSPSALSEVGLDNPDRIFSSEVLFGLDNPNMYDTYLNEFRGNLVADSILQPIADNLGDLFEEYDNDYRYRSSWVIDGTTNNANRVFQKFADVRDSGRSFRFFQPLLRMTEFYLMLAECSPDIEEAEFYLNQVRNNRGMADVSFTETTKQNFITAEFRKEMWGEGQIFFYYKRLNFTTIPNGSIARVELPMNQNRYVVPLPQSETNYR